MGERIMAYQLLDETTPTKGYALLPEDIKQNTSTTKVSDNPIVALGAGLGAGVGNVALGAQSYLGKGLDYIGAHDAGKWLINDAEQGKSKLANQLHPYEQASPISAGVGKIGGEIAATLPVGGVIAKPITMAGEAVPAIASVTSKISNALKSGGFSTGAPAGSTLIGKVGNAAIRVGGGAATGAATAGLVDPDSASTGGAIGGAIPVLGKVAGTVTQALGNYAAPLYQGGKNRIVADLLLSKAGKDPQQVINNLNTAKGNTAGFNPTTGQAANSADLATMERVFRDSNPSKFDDSATSQNKALTDAVRGIGGDDITRQSLVNARSANVDPLYASVKNSPVSLTPQLDSILQRPSMVQATNRAGKLSSENGLPFDLNSLNGQGAQHIKMALDDMVNTAPQSGIGSNELNAIKNTKGDFLNELEQQIPEYLQANNIYKEASVPINQHDLGNAIADKYIPAMYRDVEVPNSLNHDQLAKVLYDNGDRMAKNVTGFKGATLDNTLRPDQMETIKNAVADANYIKNGQLKGKSGGSSTFQNLSFNNEMNKSGLGDILSHIPLGPIGGVLKTGRDLVYKNANAEMESQLADALMNPQKAAQMMGNRLDNKSRQTMIQMLKNPALVNAPAVISAQ